MLILLKIFEKISILVTISKILDFPQMFGNLNIGQRFKKNLSFGKIFRKYCFFVSISGKYLDFGQNF